MKYIPRRPAWTPLILVLPGTILVLFLFVYPYLQLIINSFYSGSWGIQAYESVLGSSLVWKVMRQTFYVAVIATGVTLLVSYPLAYLASTARPRMGKAILWITLVPLWTSILVRLYAWMVLLGRNGIINTLLLKWGIIERPLSILYSNTAVIIGTVHYLIPFMVLALYSTMRSIDGRYVEASSTMGASGWQTFTRVYFPLTLPGVSAGCILSFILALGFYVTPALLGGARSATVPVFIDLQVHQFQWPQATVTSLVLLLFVGAVLVLQKLLSQNGYRAAKRN